MTDIVSSMFVQQQAYGQMATGQAMIKQAAKQDQAIATILDNAVQAAPGAGRGTQLDIVV